MTQGLGEKITFRCTTSDTTPIFISGNTHELGSWDPAQAVPMQRQQCAPGNGEWSHQLELLHGQTVEFKFLKKTPGGILWENGDNRRYTAIPGPHSLTDAFRE